MKYKLSVATFPAFKTPHAMEENEANMEEEQGGEKEKGNEK